MRRRTLTLCAYAMALCLVAGVASAQDLAITIFLGGGDTYVLGQDTLELSVVAGNYGPNVDVDVHIAVLPPGGGILEAPDWNASFNPMFGNLMLPQWFSFGPAVLAAYSAGDFPFDQPGDYLFAAAFTEPGTLNFLGDISFVPFTLVDQGSPGETVGRLDFGLSEAYSSLDGAWDTMVFASGMFYESYETKGPVALNDEEGCEVTVHEANGDTQPGKYLDAGDKIDMQGSPLGNVELQKFEWMGIIMYSPSAELELGHYANGSTYAFTGYGGPDVGAFNVSVVAPDRLELYEPSLEPVPTISRSQDLDVRWNGTGQGQVFVGITSIQIDPVTFMPSSYTCLCCVFDDDGEATIDASYMSQLDATPEGGYYMPGFSISRVNHTTFSAGGLPDGGAAYATVDMTGDVDLQ